jgi:glycosyltransferase involved in cell wall biosynthesis
MRIGFDISQTGALKAGCGHFAQSLIEALTQLDRENEYIVYPTFGTGYWDPRHTAATWRTERANVRRGPEGLTHAESRTLWQSPGPTLEPAIGSPDLIHANNYYCPRQIRSRIVYTLYDLVALDYPDSTTEANRLVCAGGLLDASIHADMMVAISNATRTRYLELFPHYPSSRVRTVYPASRFGPHTVVGELPASLTPGGFWLAVGTLEPRKNLRRLIRAYAALIRAYPDASPLVVAGGVGWLEDDFDDFVAAAGVADRVSRLGYVAEPVLASLYSNCLAFVYPSLVEGFGLPVLEAMSLGAPVVTSNRSSLAEIAADAAVTVHPEDEAALAAAMQRLEHDQHLRLRLRDAGLRRAAAFSWSAAARAVLDLYAEVLQRPSFGEEADASQPSCG